MKNWLVFLFVFYSTFAICFDKSFAKDTTFVHTDTSRQFGIFVVYNHNDHNPNFAKLPGIPNCCQGFTDGLGSGFTAGLFLEMPMPLKLYAGLRASLSQLDGWLKEKETTFIRDGNEIINGIFEHNIKSNILTLGLEPYLRFKIFQGLSLFAGGRVAFPVAKKFEQWEQIVEPVDKGIFIDSQSRIRNRFSGEIPKAKPVQSDLHFGLSYDLPLNRHKSLFISPFVSYHFGLSDVADSVIWKINSLRIGIGIKYLPIKIEKPKKIPPKKEYRRSVTIDTLIVEKEDILKSTFVRGIEIIDSTVSVGEDLILVTEKVIRVDTIYKKPKPVAKIDINTGTIYLETQFVTQAFPLLPIVFFERNSTQIGDFYSLVSSPEEFNFDNLPTNPLELNKHILNILGFRLKQKADSKITVIGYSDSTTEKADCELARRRANSIKEYLVKVWKIEPNRIQVQTAKERCYPRNRTITPNDSGYAENRRIEITSSDPDILEPISKRRFLEIIDYKPKILKFDPSSSKLYGIRSWKLEVKSQDSSILSYTGTENPTIIQEHVQDKLINLLTQNQTLDVYFELVDIEGNISIDHKQIKVVNDTNEVEIQRLSLILFDVSSAEIPPSTRAEIKKFLSVNSELTRARIIGYSDILGDQDFNYSLSQKRAEKTLELVKSFDPRIEIVDMKGVGSSAFPPGINSYSTPAERFLSRTVYIELIKKWK